MSAAAKRIRPSHAWDHLHLYFDGSARPKNPGPAGGAWILLTPEKKGVAYGYEFLSTGDATNNIAEYHGFILGLQHLCNMEETAGEYTIIGDSNLVIQQMNGAWKCKSDNLKERYGVAKELLAALRKRGGKVTLEHQGRKHNPYADFLAGNAVDERLPKTTRVIKGLPTMTMDYIRTCILFPPPSSVQQNEKEEVDPSQ
jgi:probable phosphoglycerate mutase